MEMDTLQLVLGFKLMQRGQLLILLNRSIEQLQELEIFLPTQLQFLIQVQEVQKMLYYKTVFRTERRLLQVV